LAEGRSVGFTFYARDQFDGVARRVSASMDRIRQSLAGVERAGAGANRAAAATAGGLAVLARRAGTLAGAYLGARGVVASIRAAATEQQALNRVLATIRSPVDRAQNTEAITQAIKANVALGHSYEDVSAALANHFDAVGVSAASLTKFAEAAKLATVTNQSLGDSVEAVNKFAEAFPELAQDRARATALLFSTFQEDAQSFPALLSNLPAISRRGAAAGLTPERTLALFSTLEAETGSPEAAASASASILRFLTTRGPKQRAAIARQLHFDTTPQGLAEAGLGKQLERLAKIARENPPVLKALGLGGSEAILAGLTREEIGSMGGLEFRAFEDRMSGALATASARVEESVARDMASFSAASNEAAVALGELLTPAVRAAAGALRGLAEGRGQAAAPNPISRYLVAAPIDAVAGALRGAAADRGARPKGQ
jgi:TP901 family phage tail tape measure protein